MLTCLYVVLEQREMNSLLAVNKLMLQTARCIILALSPSARRCPSFLVHGMMPSEPSEDGLSRSNFLKKTVSTPRSSQYNKHNLWCHIDRLAISLREFLILRTKHVNVANLLKRCPDGTNRKQGQQFCHRTCDFCPDVVAPKDIL